MFFQKKSRAYWSIFFLLCASVALGSGESRSRRSCCRWFAGRYYAKKIFKALEKREKISTDALVKEISTLIDKGADVNARDADKKPLLFHVLDMYSEMQLWPEGTPKSLIAQRSQLILEVLMKAGVDPNRGRNLWGDSSLHEAVSNVAWFKTDCLLLSVRSLLRARADVNAQDVLGKTPLNLLLNYYSSEYLLKNAYACTTIDLLLQHGANPDIKDSYGVSAWKLIEECHNEVEIKKLFRSYWVRKKREVAETIDAVSGNLLHADALGVIVDYVVDEGIPSP